MSPGSERWACTDGERVLSVGFYAFFSPVSYSVDTDPDADGFNTHLGYEADLLSALEAMEGAGLVFSRRGIARWDDIWLESAGAVYDIVGGGITILDSRTRDASGTQVVVFTSGHIVFRQSLLVRAQDAARLANHSALTSNVVVGALAGTTGEFRLLELTGLVDAKRCPRDRRPCGYRAGNSGRRRQCGLCNHPRGGDGESCRKTASLPT